MKSETRIKLLRAIDKAHRRSGIKALKIPGEADWLCAEVGCEHYDTIGLRVLHGRSRCAKTDGECPYELERVVLRNKKDLDGRDG